jgi:6-phosphofructokinase 1
VSSHIRRIAICTGGGDAPGLNAVIRAVVIAAANRGWECYGIREGYNGILFPNAISRGRVPPHAEQCAGHCHLGGTILGTTNKGNPLHFPMKMPDGTTKDMDRTDEILEFFAKKELDALVSIGGDGSLTIANALHLKGLRVVGVPKTIDNDLDKTFTTFGFDSAVSFATECVDRLHSTAQRPQRIMVVEVMGRCAGWIALHAGIAGGAHAILIPEIPFDLDKVAAKILDRDSHGVCTPSSSLPKARKPPTVNPPSRTTCMMIGHAERLGGIGERITRVLQDRTGKDARVVVLGHLLRGGSPTSFDRLAAMRFGAAAVRGLAQGQSGVMVALAFPDVNYVALEDVAGRMKGVPLDCDTLQTGRDMGICFGD